MFTRELQAEIGQAPAKTLPDSPEVKQMFKHISVINHQLPNLPFLTTTVAYHLAPSYWYFKAFVQNNTQSSRQQIRFPAF